MPAIIAVRRAEIGQKFIEPPPFDLEGSFNDSTSTRRSSSSSRPASGPDALRCSSSPRPRAAARSKSISLGQGQGPHAEKMLSNGQEKGNWVVPAELPPLRLVDGHAREARRGDGPEGRAQELPPVAHLVPLAGLPRAHLAERRQDDQRAAQGARRPRPAPAPPSLRPRTAPWLAPAPPPPAPPSHGPRTAPAPPPPRHAPAGANPPLDPGGPSILLAAHACRASPCLAHRGCAPTCCSRTCRPDFRPRLLLEVPEAGRVAADAFRALLPARVAAGAAQVRPARLEHLVRVQRVRPAHLGAPAADVDRHVRRGAASRRSTTSPPSATTAAA